MGMIEIGGAGLEPEHVGAERRRPLWSLDPPGSEVDRRRRGTRGLHPAAGPDLSAVAEALGRGRGQLLLVTGERGTGRSRLAMRILDRVRSVSDVAAVGRCQPGEAGDTGAGGALRTKVPESLVRAIAWARPDGPASHLMAETSADPGTTTDLADLAEELALVLVAEAVRRPVTVVLEDIHLADEGTCAFVDHLLAVVDAVPLLLVVTAATGWGAQGANPGRWRGWIGRHGVQHIPVAVPSRQELVAALGQVCPERIPPDQLEGILAASLGNPRLAQEIAVWTLGGARPGDLSPGCLVHQLVAAHDEDRILGAVAVAGKPVCVRLIAAVTSTSTTRARMVLERARTAGVVDRDAASGSGDVYLMAHPMFAAAARDLLSEDTTRALHLAIFSALVAEHSSDAAMAPDIARHLVASGHPRTDSASWCLTAASWCEAAGRLRDGAGFAQAGLDADPDLPTRVQLERTLTRCYRRLGESQAAAGALRSALRAASGQPRYSVPVAVELVELRDCVTVTGAESLLAEASAACPADRPDLKARLAAVEAAQVFRRDPASGRRAADRAVRVAQSVGDETARVRTLTVAAQTLMDPAHLDDLERVSGRLIEHPGVDGLAAAAAAALARGDRDRLDFVLREYAWRESQQPHQPTRDELTLLRAAVAVVDGRKAVLNQALLHLSTASGSRVAMLTSLLPLLWNIHTGGTIRSEGQDSAGLPGGRAIAELLWLGQVVTRTAAPRQAEIDLVRKRLGGPDEILRPRPDGTSWAWLAAAARFAALTRDRELSAQVVDALEPFVDQFVVVWPYLPVGPVGWFLAGPLRALGAQEKAAEALLAAQRVSDGLGAAGWSLRVGAERSRLLSPDNPPSVDDVVQTTIGPVRARRFPGVIAQIRCTPGGRPSPMRADTAGRYGTPASGPVPGPSSGPSSGLGAGQRSAPGQGMPGRTGAGAPGASSQGGPATPLPRLTPRETDIMALAATGCTNQEIARRLFLSVATVERHCTNLYRRLGVRNRAQALGILGPLGSLEGRS
jgi:DNA-binding CsgD family transcriptional regulator